MAEEDMLSLAGDGPGDALAFGVVVVARDLPASVEG